MPSGLVSPHLSLLRQRLAHDSVLASHPPAQSALDLSSESEFVQVVRLLLCGDESLLVERLAFEALEAIVEVVHVRDSGVTGGKSAVCAIGGSQRGASTDGGESLRGSGLHQVRLARFLITNVKALRWAE